MQLAYGQALKIANVLGIQSIGDRYRTIDWEQILRMAAYAGLDVKLKVDRMVRNHRRLSGDENYQGDENIGLY